MQHFIYDYLQETENFKVYAKKTLRYTKFQHKTDLFQTKRNEDRIMI